MKNNNSTLFSTVKGQGERVVLLLHGLFGSSDNLGRIGSGLAELFQVHALDLRNHGNSPHHSSMSYELMAKDVVDYMDMNKLSVVDIVGHSMGGKVAMQLALDYPDRIRKLIVADIAPVTYPAHHEAIFAGLFSLDLEKIKSRSEADKGLSRYIDTPGIRQFLLKNLSLRKQGGFEWKMNLDVIYNNYKDILIGLSSDLPFPGKVLFIAGGLSDYIKPEYKIPTLKLFPHSELKAIPGTTHWLHAEKPDTFVGVCKRFLNA